MLRFHKSITNGGCDLIAREIAERCAAATLSQLNTAAGRMSAAELRGYVRARAWPWICAEVRQVDLNEPLTKTEKDNLAARALEQAVHLVTSAYMASPVVAMPTPHIGLRAAA